MKIASGAGAQQHVMGVARVGKVFSISQKGEQLIIGGLQVRSGEITRDMKVRVRRDEWIM